VFLLKPGTRRAFFMRRFPAGLCTVFKVLCQAQVKQRQDPHHHITSAEVRSKLFHPGWQVVGSSSKGLASRIAADTAALGDVICSQKSNGPEIALVRKPLSLEALGEAACMGFPHSLTGLE
jgi:hypothetical protein